MWIYKYWGHKASFCCEKEIEWGLFNHNSQAKMPVSNVSPTIQTQSCKAEREVRGICVNVACELLVFYTDNIE